MRNQLGAGAEFRVVELAAAGVLAKVLGVGFTQESALMMVKPPGKAVGAGIFEVDDHVLVADKHVFIKELACPMDQPSIGDFRRRVKFGAIQSRKKGGGSSPIKAFIMKANQDLFVRCHNSASE